MMDVFMVQVPVHKDFIRPLFANVRSKQVVCVFLASLSRLV
jgi:hypothetical protein